MSHTKRIHQVEQHHLAVPGLEAITLISNHHFPRHSHDQFGIGVIIAGAQRSWSGLGQVEAGAGDVIMTNPGEIHDGAPLDGKARCWRMIYLDPLLVYRELVDEVADPTGMVRPVAQDPRLAKRFARLFACLTAPHRDDFAREQNLLCTLVHMFRRHGMGRPVPKGSAPSFRRALQRMDAAGGLPVRLSELAALSGVSRFQFLRSFAREMGTTPHAYLLQRRVLLARRLLAGGQSLAQAALQAGFADQSHMTRAFVRQFGITPGGYRAAIA